MVNAQKLINDEIIERDDLKYIEKQAFSRIVLHIASAAKKDLKQLLVQSNDTDVAMYNLAYFCLQHNECQQNLGKIWNSWTQETYTSLPVSRDLRNRKIATAA